MSTASAHKTVTLSILDPYATSTDDDKVHYVVVAEDDARALYLDLRRFFEKDLATTAEEGQLVYPKTTKYGPVAQEVPGYQFTINTPRDYFNVLGGGE